MILSIIIPVYNVEKYIVGCLESIYSQGADESHFEVIIVNDGTKDNSIEKIQLIIEKKDNCTLINQENQGLSVARNTGLRKAKGKYVWFVDSDDQVAPGALNSILGLIENRNEDIVAFNVIIRDEETGKEKIGAPFENERLGKNYNSVYSGTQALGRFHKGLVQRYILRRDFLFANNLFFLPGIWYEDDQLLVRLFCFIKNIYVSSITSYVYLTRKCGSIMSTLSVRTINDSFVLIDTWKNFVVEYSIGPDKKQWVNYNIYKYYYYILSLRNSPIEGYKDCMQGRWLGTKMRMLYYSFLSWKFMSCKAMLRTFVFCFCPSLILRRTK